MLLSVFNHIALKRRLAHGANFFVGRFNALNKSAHRFNGLHNTRQEAENAVSPSMLVGYNHDEIAEVSFEKMCEIAPWDYPVLFWLERLLTDGCRVLDAGGHMGTKFRAFSQPLRLNERRVDWVVYDLPAIVRAGRSRAQADGLRELSFIEKVSDAGHTDITLASGLLQYLDISFSDFLRQMPALPGRLIVNKVAVWGRKSAFTLENFGSAYVPYQIRNQQDFLSEIELLGYQIEDRWTIPSLSHKIPTHPHLGRTQSVGFYLELNSTTATSRENSR